MTIRQLPKPCFILDPSPWGDDHGTPHYATRAEADEELRERRGELGPDPAGLVSIETVRARRLDAACWVAECDAPRGMEGTCGETLGDDEEGPSCIHFETVEELFGWMPGEGWVRVFPDGAFCGNDAKLGGWPVLPPQVPPAELEAAGQMRLPGVA